MKRTGTPLVAKGFTLIELLLYTVIVGTLLLAVVSFYSMSASARVKNQTIDEVNQQGILAMNTIMRTVRNASGITMPANGATGSSLTLTVPAAAQSPTVFSLSSATLQVTEGAGTAVPLTNSKIRVTDFTVKNLTRSGTYAHVQVSLTLARTNDNNRYEFDYQKTFTSSGELQW